MKYTFLSTITALVALVVLCSFWYQKPKPSKKDDIIVAAYYFPNYHTGDKRNSENPDKGPNWSEWDLVKKAVPRFENHYQPLQPQWGYTDEKDPAVMEKKIDAATSNGVNCFIFDWYMYEDGPFLNRCIDEGFLKAKNVKDIKFALMWANHDWVDIHPYKMGAEQKVLYPCKFSMERFEEIGQHVIDKYFKQSNYLLIDGRPYFSIYHIEEFLKSFGTIENARKGMDKLDAMAKKAGFKGIHWNLVAWGNPILPGENVPSNLADLVKGLRFQSATSYVWVHHVHLPQTQTDYNYVKNEYFKHWETADSTYGVPYFPNVTVGWDPTPRCDTSSQWAPTGYPFMNTIGNNTPQNFKLALEETKKKLLASKNPFKMMNINCWNEWTEGSQLEPEKRYGMAYLEAVRDVFKPVKKK